MKTTGSLPCLAFIAILASASAVGCSSVDISDRQTYDKYYAESNAARSASRSSKIVFYVPYRKFDITHSATGDTTPVLDALKTVFGDAVSFEESVTAPYIVDVKSVTETKEEGFTARTRVVADFIDRGRVREITGEYDVREPGLGIQHVYTLYRAAAVDLARQIKSWMAPELQ